MKKTIFFVIVVIAAGVVAYWNFSGSSSEAEYEYVLAERGNIVQEVDITGRVKAVEEVDLAFERTGRVASIANKVGDTVARGSLLVRLEQTSLSANLAQARASVDNATANLRQQEAGLSHEQITLSELTRGTRQEEIAIQKSELDAAKQNLASEYSKVKSLLLEKYAKADDAVRKQTDEMFTADHLPSPQLTFVTTNSQAEIDAEFERFMAEQKLVAWLNEVNALNPTSADEQIDAALTSSLTHLEIIRNFLDTMAVALEGAASISQATITTYKTNLNTGRANVAAAITAISAQQQSISSAKLSVQTAENELNLLQAGSTPETIAAQQARVKQAEANVAAAAARVAQSEADVIKAQADLATTELRAPFAGVVTALNVKVGEIVSINTVIVSLIAPDELEIEALIPEADIVKVALGNKARLTLDAYGDDIVFEATVINIDPAAELNEGVATYKTTLVFDETDTVIRSGMTADMDIITAEREAVVMIPQRAIVFRDGKKFVQILLPDGNVREAEIETGVSGNRGMVEIIRGVNENDRVVTGIKNDK